MQQARGGKGGGKKQKKKKKKTNLYTKERKITEENVRGLKNVCRTKKTPQTGLKLQRMTGFRLKEKESNGVRGRTPTSESHKN